MLFRAQPHVGFQVLSYFHQPFFQPFQQGFQDPGVPSGMLLTLTVLYLVTALPFFCAGVTLSLLFSRYHQDFSRLYFWDLAGRNNFV